jgi:hypothetical protein
MGNLGGGVNTAIGTSGPVQSDGMTENISDRCLDFSLYTSVIGLPLPAVEISSHVLNN